MPDYRKTHKSNKGNKYRYNAEFAEEVTAKNGRQITQTTSRPRVKK